MDPCQPLPSRRLSRQGQIAVGLTGVVVAAGLWGLALGVPQGIFGLSNEPRFAGYVDLATIRASVATNLTNATEGSLRADPVWLPHCSNAYYYEGALHLYTGHYGRPYDPAAKAFLIVDYAERRSFSGGGDDQLVGEIDAKGITVYAALNASTPLYLVAYGLGVRLVPQQASRDIEGHVSLQYTVRGAFDPARPGAGPANLTVTEVHTMSIAQHVPVYTKVAQYPCL